MNLSLSVFFLLFFSSLLSIESAAQTIFQTNDSTKKGLDVTGEFNNAEIHLASVNKRPEFVGDKKAWQEFLRNNINLSVPFSNKATPGTYKIMIRFIVANDGELRDIGAESNCGYGMESEIIRCIKKSPAWIPAETSSGKAVRFTLRQIVIFIVKTNNVEISFQ